MNDPANRPFLDALGRGEAPRELLGSSPGEAIHVNCMRSNSDYKAPPKNMAFTGRGQTLSSQGKQHLPRSLRVMSRLCLIPFAHLSEFGAGSARLQSMT